jgi:hypothetical protein
VVRKRIAILVVVLLFGFLGTNVYFNLYYAHTRPEAPQPTAGRTFPLNVHGTIVYLTREEHLRVDVSFWGVILLAIAGGVYRICTIGNSS